MRPFFIRRLPLLACIALGVGCDEGGGLTENKSKIVSLDVEPSANAIRTSSIAASCDLTEGAVVRCTPDNLGGRIFAMGAMLGLEENGHDNFNLTFMADDEEIILDPSQATHPEGRSLFDLQNPVTVSGLIAVPDASNMPSTPTIWRIESYFDYVDATVSVDGTVAGTYTIRTVFRATAASDDIPTGNTMEVGDKMLRAADGLFYWCDDEGCDHATRPSDPHRSSAIVQAYDRMQQGDQPGNPNYAGYAIDFRRDDYLDVTHAEITDPTRLWTIDFDIQTAVQIDASEAITDQASLVEAFELGLGCGYEGCEVDEARIYGSLEIGPAAD